jgi:hypothetical protein
MKTDTLPLVVLAFLIGGLVGALVGPAVTSRAAEPPQRVATFGPTSAPGNAAPNGPSEGSGLASAESPRRAAEDRAGGVSELALERARAVAEASSVPAAASAPGFVTGFVRDDQGRPVAGVELRLRGRGPRSLSSTDSARLGQGLAPATSLDEALASAARRWVESSARDARATTDESGAYSLPALGGEHGSDVDAGLAGQALEPLGRADGLLPGDTLDFVARPLARVLVDVIDTDGRPLDEAHLQTKGTSVNTALLWRRGTPLLVEPVRTSLRAHRGLVPSEQWDVVDSLASSEWGSVDPLPGEEVALQLVLVARTRVAGRIVDPSGALLDSYSEVRATPRVDDELELARGLDGTPQRAGVERGRFVMLDLVPGEWVLAVEAPGGEFVAHTTVVVGREPVEASLVVPDAPLGAVLEVEVLSERGTAVRDFALQLVDTNGNGRELYDLVREPSGVALVRLDELAPGAEDPLAALAGALLVASMPSGQGGRAKLEPGATRVTIRLDPPARLVVAVHGLVGTPLEAAVEVDLSYYMDFDPSIPGSAGRRQHRNWNAEPRDGVWTFHDLQPGYYEVVLAKPQPMPGVRRELRLARRVVHVVGDEVRLDLDVPRIVPVRVVAPGYAPGCSFMLLELQGEELVPDQMRPWQSALVDEQGIATFDEVVAGRYELSSADSDAKRTVEVPCGDVIFDAPAWNAVRVVVVDAQGTLAARGLRDGDLLVGMVGAADFAPRTFHARLRDGSGQPLLVRVQRGGESFEVDLAPLMTGRDWLRDLGGQLVNARLE